MIIILSHLHPHLPTLKVEVMYVFGVRAYCEGKIGANVKKPM